MKAQVIQAKCQRTTLAPVEGQKGVAGLAV
jgi:hypothetical protein